MLFLVGTGRLSNGPEVIEWMKAFWPRKARSTNVLLWVLSDLHLDSTRGWDLPSETHNLIST